MLSDQEIRDAYVFILGRMPESPEIYRQNREVPDLNTFRETLLRSEEFRDRYAANAKPVAHFAFERNPASSSRTTPDILDRFFQRMQQEWTRFGQEDPYWSVLTHDRFRTGNIATNRDEFYATGLDDVRAFQAALLRNRLAIKPGSVCVELGCGVGRVSMHLAPLFRTLHGYDISPGNLAIAQQHLSKLRIGNAEFSLLRSLADYAELKPFDVFVSSIVLQHNPPPVSRCILEHVTTRANPGAILFFQIVTYGSQYRFDAKEYLASPPGGMEVHAIPQAEVFDILRRGNCHVIEVMEDNAVGSELFLSNTFVAVKR